MTSAVERKAQLLAEQEMQLVREWEEIEEHRRREEEEFAWEMVDLELKEEEEE